MIINLFEKLIDSHFYSILGIKLKKEDIQGTCTALKVSTCYHMLYTHIYLL